MLDRMVDFLEDWNVVRFRIGGKVRTPSIEIFEFVLVDAFWAVFDCFYNEDHVHAPADREGSFLYRSNGTCLVVDNKENIA